MIYGRSAAYAGLGIVVVAATALALPDAARAWAFEAFGTVTFVAVLLGARRLASRDQQPWLLLALGILLRVAGDATWTVFERVYDLDVTGPSGADIFYLGSYPAFAGALLLIRRRAHRAGRGSVLDALILATAAGLLSWAFVIDSYMDAEALGLLERVTAIAYPVADLVLLGIVIRLAFAPGPRQVAYHLLVGAFSLLLAGDALRALDLENIQPHRALTQAFLLASLSAFGAAALHPSTETIASPWAGNQPTRIGIGRRFALGVAGLVAPAVLLSQPEVADHPDLRIIAVTAAALSLLAVARMHDLTVDLSRTLGGLKRAADRELILRQVGGRLVSARGRDGIYLATIDAVHRLIEDVERVRVFFAIGSEMQMTTVAVSGSNGDRARGLPVRFDRLDTRSRVALLEGYAIDVEGGSLIETDSEGEWILSGRATLAVPIVSSEQELNGALLITSDDPLPLEYRDGLTALAAQVSLALESAALTEDLLRRQSEAHFRSLVQASSDVIVIADADGRTRYASPSVERMLGYTPDEIVTHVLSSLVHPDDVAAFEEYAAAAGKHAGTSRAIEYRTRHRNGTWRFVETIANNLLDDPTVHGLVFTTRDVTESRALEDQLRHQAFHDPLTGLANRALFTDRVSHALARRNRGAERAAVLFFDLDDFKTVNDSLGHGAGDELLREFARRLTSSLRASDTAARLGGDEFAVLLEDVDGAEAVVAVAEHILDALRPPVVLEGRQVRIATSVGIALETPARESVEVLLRNADAAMYAAKTLGGSSFRVFEPSMHSRVVARLELGAALGDALQEDELSLRYQPIVDLATGRVVKCEALLRWQHPHRGLVSPLEFIPLAEETGIIVKIGNWLLHEACRRASGWLERFPASDLSVAVNVSGRQLEEESFVRSVEDALAATGLRPEALTLEITESVLMHDAVDRLQQLKRLGVQLAIDDFGTGYSSLGYLRQFPIDIIKIDRSFVTALDGLGRESQLVRTIVELARGLGTRTVAEGIETGAQAQELAALGCDYGQGFHFSHPLETSGFEALLERTQTAASTRVRERSA